MVDDDYFRYKYTAYKLYVEDNSSDIDDSLCFNCHYTSIDLFKEKYKTLFGEELDMDILKKYAYKIENNKVHSDYNIGGDGSAYTVKFNHVVNLKNGKKYIFDLIDVKDMLNNFDDLFIQSLYYKVTSHDYPYFETTQKYNTKIELEYDNDNHLKSFILKEY